MGTRFATILTLFLISAISSGKNWFRVLESTVKNITTLHCKTQFLLISLKTCKLLFPQYNERWYVINVGNRTHYLPAILNSAAVFTNPLFFFMPRTSFWSGKWQYVTQTARKAAKSAKCLSWYKSVSLIRKMVSQSAQMRNCLTKPYMPINLTGKMNIVFHLKISERKNVLGLSEFSLVDVQPSPYDSRG